MVIELVVLRSVLVEEIGQRSVSRVLTSTSVGSINLDDFSFLYKVLGIFVILPQIVNPETFRYGTKVSVSHV